MTERYQELMEDMLRNSTGVTPENKAMVKMYNEVMTVCGGHSGVGPQQALIALAFLSPFVAPFFASFPEAQRRDIARTWLKQTLSHSKDFIGHANAMSEAKKRPT